MTTTRCASSTAFHRLDEAAQIRAARALVGRRVRVDLDRARAGGSLPASVGDYLLGSLVTVAFRFERGRPVLVIDDHLWPTPVAVTTYWVRALSAAAAS